MKSDLPPIDPTMPIKSAAEVLRDNPNLPAGAKAHLRAWVRGDLHPQDSADNDPSEAKGKRKFKPKSA